MVLHYYAGDNPHVQLLEKELLHWIKDGTTHYRAHNEEKLCAAAYVLPKLYQEYDYYCFLDDDIQINTTTLNAAFAAGKALHLPLYQPALSYNSICGWDFLRTRFDPSKPGASLHFMEEKPRLVPMVEIMMPFFSRSALLKCLPTFDFNCSGWGTDLYQWPTLVGHETFVLDWITAGHYATATRRQRKLENGLTPYQEFWISQWIFAKPDCLPSIIPPGDECDSMRIAI